jgi:hypothetical protein
MTEVVRRAALCAAGCVLAAGLAAGALAGAGSAASVTAARSAAQRCATAPGGGLTLANVAAAGGVVRAVGSNGLIASTRDLSRWRVERSPVVHNLRGIAWTGRRWVAVGDVGSIIYRRGTQWVAVPGIPPTTGLRGVAARPGLVVASGSAGVLFTSPDGIHWTLAQSGTTRLLWGGTRVGSSVAVSGQDSTVIASRNGVDWKSVLVAPLPTGNTVAPRPLLWQLASAGRQLVAVGDFGAILQGTLTRGLRGVHSPTVEILRGVTHHGGSWVAVGSGGVVLSSRDGRRWRREPDPTTVDLRGVAWAGRRFVAVGDEGTVISSADGARWRVDQTAMPCALLGLARGAGRFVAVGGRGRVQVSTDGRRWASVPPPTREDLYGVGHGPRGFVAVGASGTVLTSRSGRRWIRVTAPTRLNLRAVSWTGSHYLAGGDRGVMLSSPDARRWRRVRFPGFHSIRGFATDRTTVIAVGAGTIARQSDPSASWQLETIGLGKFQTGVACGDGRFVVVGHNGGVQVSRDGGMTWSPGTSGVTDNFDAVIWTGTRFVATGDSFAIASSDGFTWYQLASRARHSLRALAIASRDVLAVGDLNAHTSFPR